MTLRVPGIPPRLLESGDNQIRAALPVMGYAQWVPMGSAANWLAGVGGSLGFIGANGPVVAPAGSATWRMYCWPRAQHGTWMWSVQLEATSSNAGGFGTLTVSPGGDAFGFTLPDSQPHEMLIVHNPSSVATGEASIQLSVDTGSPSNVRLLAVGLYELPRVVLPSTGGSVGVHETSCAKGQSIYENTTTTDKFSAQAVWEQIRDAKNGCRRQAIFNWYNPTGLTSTLTAFSGTSNLFTFDPPMQIRKIAQGDDQRMAALTCYANVTGGGAVGEVRVVMTTGGSTTITVTNTTAAWATPATFAVECDDFSESDAIHGGTRDYARFEIRKTAGTSITVYGISVGEAP